MVEIGMTNGYPDADAEIARLREELMLAEEQLGWCDKPWDDFKGWRETVDGLKAQLRLMGHAERAMG